MKEFICVKYIFFPKDEFSDSVHFKVLHIKHQSSPRE